ncbi:unnamed protein product [Linum tenue]|uniref:DM2 domain-containing protein n=1 Tax=Linum tenue TaxID=586396 RepID=A0AAV0QKK1_9ROSI|nr:unnamed protein product [Linum tenue]
MSAKGNSIAKDDDEEANEGDEEEGVVVHRGFWPAYSHTVKYADNYNAQAIWTAAKKLAVDCSIEDAKACQYSILHWYMESGDMNDFNFEQRDWMTVQPQELRKDGSKLIMKVARADDDDNELGN